jgi:DNA-binding PadR family transcriptional regulator
MIIKITDEVIDLCEEHGIQSEHIGSCISYMSNKEAGNHSGISILRNKKVDYSSYVLCKMLELEKLIEEIPSDNSIEYKLTEKGKDFLQKYKQLVSDKDSILNTIDLEVEEWIEDWRKLWKDKRGVFYKTPDKRSLGISKKDALEKMKWFLNNYGDIFDFKNTAKNTIIGATKTYIDEYKKVGFAFCKKPNFFISKREDRTKDSLYSTLASECENYIANKGSKKNSSFKRST